MKMKLNFILKYLLSLYLSVFYFFPSFGSPGRNCTTNLSRSSPQLNQAPQTGRNSSGNQGNNHWLYDHENRGGHLISRHISKSDDELRNRANIERKVSVSSFHNFETFLNVLYFCFLILYQIYYLMLLSHKNDLQIPQEYFLLSFLLNFQY